MYNNIDIPAQIGHKTSAGTVTEVYEDGRVKTDRYQGSHDPKSLSLCFESKDCSIQNKVEHQDAQVLVALLSGHIVTIDGKDYRYAQKDQPLYENTEGVFVANESGLYVRAYYYLGSDTTPHDFRWIGQSGSDLESIRNLISRMSTIEKLTAISGLALESLSRERA